MFPESARREMSASMSSMDVLRAAAEDRFPLTREESHSALKKDGIGKSILKKIGSLVRNKFGDKLGNLASTLALEVKRIIRKIKGMVAKYLTNKYGDKLGGLAAGVLDEALDLVVPAVLDGITEGIQLGLSAIL